MEKQLSDLLVDFKPNIYSTANPVLSVDFKDYEKLRSISLELAIACERINDRAKEYSKCNGSAQVWTNEALLKSKEILEYK